MESTELTIEILKSIRDEIKDTKTTLSARIDQTNGRLDQMSGRIDQTNGRLDEMREELSTRIVHSEIRTATAITELAGTVREMTSVVRASVEMRPRIERCEEDIRELRDRLDRVTPR